MTTQKKVLGRGLSALMEDAPREEIKEIASTMNDIPVEDITVNPFQPRKEFEEESLKELSGSIAKNGIIQPITVRAMEDGSFQLITGERRLRASKLAGLESIPAYIRTVDDQGLLEMALVENIQREDLNAIEIAISYQRLMDECDLTQELLSERVGKKRSTITNYVRLLKLPPEIQLGLREKKISMGHARALINMENPKSQVQIFNRIIMEGLSVRSTEELVRDFNQQPEKAQKVKEKVKNELPEEYLRLKDHLANHFNSKIDFKRHPKGDGKIIIAFKSDEDLERILGILDNFNR